MTRPFSGYHYVLPCDLDLGVFLKILTLQITFEQWVLPTITNNFNFMTFTLELDLLFENFKPCQELLNSDCQSFAISHEYFKWQHLCVGTNIFMPPRSKIGGTAFLPCLSLSHSIILSFCKSVWNFSLANNFWTASAIALIFHMSIPLARPFCRHPHFWTCDLHLGVWPF